VRRILLQKRKRTSFALVIGVTALFGVSMMPAAAASSLQPVQSATIAFLNPTGGTSLVVSDQAAADTTYRLLAWVDSAASGSVVEFELQAEGERPLTIGLASRDSDTFQYLWSIPASIEDGGYVLRALLFAPTVDGLVQVAHDEEAITINRSVQTVDILYPTVGGRFGTHASGGNPAVGVVDSATSGGAGYISAFYTTSAAGTEPQWQLCGTESVAEAQDGVRCTLQGGVQGTAIRGVATTVDGTGAADATKVSIPYHQTAESFVIGPAVYEVASYSDGTFPCSAPITAELLDQFARPIAGANVDIHAFGPSDQLSFDTGTVAAPGPVAAPDQAHGTLEAGYACGDVVGEMPLPQAEHNSPAIADTKHVESTAGTSDRGRFEVRLHSDATGSTELTMWADSNDDDAMVGEKNANARITWNVGDDPPPEPTLSQREVTLVASETHVRENARVRLSGAIVSEDARCATLQTVVLKRRPLGAARGFKPIKSVTTDDVGTYATRVRVHRASAYRAVAPATEICARAASPVVKVRIRS